MYIYFVCDGIITQFWGRQDPRFAGLLGITIYYRYPINLITTVTKMEFAQAYSTNVTEGKPFEKPPVIKVSGSLNFFIFLKLFKMHMDWE